MSVDSHRLESGLHLGFALGAEDSPFCVTLALRMGPRCETITTRGFTRWWVESALRGTHSFPSESAIALHLKNWGLHLNWNIESESLEMEIKGPIENAEPALRFLLEWVARPLHREALEVRKELLPLNEPTRTPVLNSWLSPHLASDAVSTWSDSLATATLDDLLAFQEDFCSPDNAVLFLEVPEKTFPELFPLSIRIFEEWRNIAPEGVFGTPLAVQPPSHPEAPFTLPSGVKGPQFIFKTAPSERLRVAFVGEGINSPHAVFPEMASRLLADGPASWLGTQLALHQHSVRGLKPYMEWAREVSAFGLEWNGDEENSPSALTRTIQEIFRWRDSILKAKEGPDLRPFSPPSSRVREFLIEEKRVNPGPNWTDFQSWLKTAIIEDRMLIEWTSTQASEKAAEAIRSAF